MSSPLRALVVIGLGLLTACNDVVTIDDMITASAATRDDRLIGDWLEIGGTDRVRVTRATTNDYLVLYMGTEDTMTFRARLGRLGSTLVMDVVPDSTEWEANKES